MKAKEYLLQVKKLDQMIQNKKVEKEMWMSMALSTTAPSDGERVQSSGSQQKMVDAVIRSVGLDVDWDPTTIGGNCKGQMSLPLDMMI